MTAWQFIIVWGVIATATMDAWSLCAKHFFRMPTLSYGLVGRWLMGLPKGSFALIDKKTPCSALELSVGWAAHYLIGIVFVWAFVTVAGDSWRKHPTLAEPIIFGLLTLAMPFLVLQPAMGAGVAARKTPRPWISRGRSAAAHLAFGVGVFLGARLLPWTH